MRLVGMNAGDITLNCHCALVLMKTLQSCDSSVSDDDLVKQFFFDYVTFMTTPGTHNDTYSESFHRFVNKSQQLKIERASISGPPPQ